MVTVPLAHTCEKLRTPREHTHRLGNDIVTDFYATSGFVVIVI
jgi:hypothetical protein